MRHPCIFICASLLATLPTATGAPPPVLFIEQERFDEALVQKPAWYGLLFPDDRVLQADLDQMWGSFLTKLNNKAIFACRRTEGNKWNAPMQVITSGPGGHEAWQMFVNATNVQGGLPVKEAPDLAQAFNLVDLFGCVANPVFYGLVSRLNSAGTLVMPFSGTDFGEITRLPRRVRKLVVYNSNLGHEFNALVEKMDALEEVVFWGCTVTLRGIPNAKFEHESVAGRRAFAALARKVVKLTLVQCSVTLAEAVGWQSLPQLEECVTTTPCFMRRRRLDLLRHNYPEVPAALPDYPRLKTIGVYRDALPASSQSLEALRTALQTETGQNVIVIFK